MKKPKATGAPCASIASGGALRCALIGPHDVHSSATPGKRGGQHATWSLIEDGRIQVITFSSGKKMGSWYEDRPAGSQPPRQAAQRCDCGGKDGKAAPHDLGAPVICEIPSHEMCMCDSGKECTHMIGAPGCEVQRRPHAMTFEDEPEDPEADAAAIEAMKADEAALANLEPDEDDDSLEDEILSDEERDFARKMREDREAHARELEADPHDGTTCGIVDGRGDGCIHKQGHDGPHSNGKRTWPNKPPKKISKIYTKAEREQLEALAARAPAKHVKVHPAADALPMIEGAEFDALVADIRANGLQHRPVTDHTGEWLVDGRNRKRACDALGIEVEYDRLPEGANIAAYVISTNLKRRHLNESQRAMIAAEIANLAQGQKKQTGPVAGLTQAEAAASAGVGERTVRRANAVRDKAVPELVAAVKQGKVDLKGAEQVAKLPPTKQRELIKERIDPAKGPVRGGKLAALAKQEEKRAVVRKINEQRVAPLPDGAFGVIYGDYPWLYENSDQHDGSRGHMGYPPMAMDEIIAHAREAATRAAKDCILALWVTNIYIPQIGRVIEAYGAEHRTMLTWPKPRAGVGTWPRGQTEHLVIASIGAPVHTLNEISTLLPSFAPAHPGEHSSKPAEIAELLAKHCAGPFLELFAREARDGWVVWGAEIGKFASEVA